MAFGRTRYDNIKERVLKYAMQLWGIEDERLLDPVVDLLLDVFAYESLKLHQTVEDSDAKLLSRLSRIIIPQKWSMPFPAHGLLMVNPQPGDVQTTLTPRDLFYTQKMMQGAESPQIFFSSLVSSPLLDARIVYKVCGNSLYHFHKRHSEQFSFLANDQRGKDFTFWVGLRTSSVQLERLKSLTLCILPSRKELIPFVSHIKAYDINGVPLLLSKTKFAKENADEHYFNDIVELYKDCFVTLSFPSTPCNTCIQAVFPDGDFGNTDVDESDAVLWIRFECPFVFSADDLQELRILLNTIPVVNRKLNAVNHNFASNGRIVALPSQHGASLLGINKVEDNAGNTFVNRLSTSDTNAEGVYSLYFGSLDSFTAEDAKTLVGKTLQHIREEGNAFSAINSDGLSNHLKDLSDKLDNVEKELAQFQGKDGLQKAFLLTIPKQESRYAEIEYWECRGEEANDIDSRNIVHQFGVDKFDPASIRFQTSTFGGTSHSTERELTQSLRYGLLSHERIISREDVRSYMFRRLGNAAKTVTIEDGVAILQDGHYGIARTTDIRVQLNPLYNTGNKQATYGLLAHAMEKELVSLSVNQSKYRIYFV